MRAPAVKSPAVSEIDRHTSIVAAEAFRQDPGAQAAATFRSNKSARVGEWALDRASCLELAAAGSRGRHLRPRPTPIRASLSGLITT